MFPLLQMVLMNARTGQLFDPELNSPTLTLSMSTLVLYGQFLHVGG